MFDYVHDPLIGYLFLFFDRAMIPTYLRGYPTYGIQQAAKKRLWLLWFPMKYHHLHPYSLNFQS